MTLHEMLRDAGFATEGRLWLESTEFRLAYQKLAEHFDDAGGLREELESVQDDLREAKRDIENLQDDYDLIEKENDALRTEAANLRDQLEELLVKAGIQ